jgi:hypothetical protein
MVGRLTWLDTAVSNGNNCFAPAAGMVSRCSNYLSRPRAPVRLRKHNNLVLAIRWFCAERVINKVGT